MADSAADRPRNSSADPTRHPGKLIDPRYDRDATKGELLPPRAHITEDGKPGVRRPQ